jgi:hypothetical protein
MSFGQAGSALLDVFALIFCSSHWKTPVQRQGWLLAVALGAGAVLQIQQAHFYTADAIAMFFVVACLFFIVRLQDTFSWGDTIAAGFSAGLAIASRINVAPVLGILALAVFVPVLSHWRDPQRKASVEGAVARLVVAGVFALIAFRIFMPYAFDGLLSFDPRWTRNMDYARRLNSGEDPGGPPGVQWTNRPAIVFPWINVVFWGLGIPLGIAAWLSWAWAAWQIFLTPYLRNRHGKVVDWIISVAQSRHLLIWIWVTGYFFWMGSSWVKSIRYQLPIYPFLTLLAAAGLMALLEWAKRRVSHAKLWRAASVAVVAVVLLGTYAWAFAFTEIYRQPTTRVAASRWIYDNVPTAVTLNLQQGSSAKALQLPFASSVLLPGNGIPQGIPFKVDQASALDSVTLSHLIDTLADDGPETIRVAVAADPAGSEVLAQADATVPAEKFGTRGGPVLLKLNPVILQPDRDYYAILTPVNGAPMAAESSTLANEHWDDPNPLRVDGRDNQTSINLTTRSRFAREAGPDDRLAKLGGLHHVDQQSSVWINPAHAAPVSHDVGILSAVVCGRTGLQAQCGVRVLSAAGTLHVP